MPLNKEEEKNSNQPKPISLREGLAVFRGLKLCAVPLLLVIIVLVSAPRPARAQAVVADFLTEYNTSQKNIFDTAKAATDKAAAITQKTWQWAASTAFASAISQTLNSIAYSTATYLGSGGTGQKPQYFTGSPIDNLESVGNAAAGYYIEDFGKAFASTSAAKATGLNFQNLCTPSLSAKISIGLGLESITKPTAPDCTASQMVQNWTKTLSGGGGKDFLKTFSGYFDISQNDLGVALSAQSSLLSAQENAKLNQQMQQGITGRYSENTNIAGKITGFPNQAANEKQMSQDLLVSNYGKYTGDALKDAASIFINQLAIKGLNTLEETITQALSKNDSANNNVLTDFNAQPSNGGVAAAQGVLLKIAQPNFSVNADYDVLAALSSCGSGALGVVGPTDCVINDNFTQAIENKETVAQAVGDGSLDGGAPFGFDSPSSQPSYTHGYPYRSMSILRKYRIIPVGWELAAQYIQAHPDTINNKQNNLTYLTSCFSSTNLADAWCHGLVDPTWVLKAPLSQCAKQGYGSQILDSQVISGGDSQTQGTLQVTRSGNYCGDEQSCIKENADGSCEYPGYCTADKRIWKFGSDNSCDANFNTCQTFTNSAGSQVSYLQNSLQYCDATNAGCHEYAFATPEGYSSATRNIDWTKNSGSIFLNKNAGTCDQSSEGCHEFIRYASDLGTNLIINSNFSNDTPGNPPANWAGNATVAYYGGKNTAHVTSDSQEAFYSKDWSSTGDGFGLAFPKGFVMEPETSYTLSANIYVESGASVTISIGRQGSTWQEVKTTNTGVWQPSVTLLNNTNIAANEIRIYGSGSNVSFFVSNIKFEVGTAQTSYTAYRSNNLIYEKFMPAYLRNVCYNNPGSGDFTIKSGAPAACNNFALQCNEDEVGCDNYTNNDNPNQTALNSIPAAATDADTCKQECDGYNTYIQSANDFSTPHLSYFIPSTAKTCSSAEVGCQEFTNLASTTAGGEQKEYYSHLRQCVKPTDSGANCGDFYTWEGSAVQGQQLVKYSLQANAGGPQVTSNDSAQCNALIYSYNPSSNPLYNADCREFYDKSGNIFYHLYSKTITCSADCASYRLTNKNKIDNIDSSADCAGVGTWDDNAQACYSCPNGGAWDANQNACVYQAIPAESTTCDASANGCAIYNGNGGANTRQVMNDVFYSLAQNDGWSSGKVNGTSNVAGGFSYQFNSSITKNVGTSVFSKGSSYTLSFIAKTDSADSIITASLGNAGGTAMNFDRSVTVKTGEWRLYTLNLPTVDQSITAAETLTINSDATGVNYVHIENIQVTQVTDRYYLIAGSWKTPDSCDKDNNGNPYPLFALGCTSYNNSAGETKYLHSFDHICQASAAGCEAMIDTQNSDSPNADSSHGATTTVAADSIIYAVYNQNYFCDQSKKGCERLGLKTSYGTDATYQDKYFVNDPNLYSSILCGASGVGCDLFSYSSGGQTATTYFKNPGNQVCEWRQSSSAASGWGWFKKKVMRCAGNGNICASSKDCSGNSCILEKADNPCPTEALKTIGAGGLGNKVMQPGSDGVNQWAGVCSDAQSSCTEYIDPVSDFSSNEVFNADFSQDIGSVKDLNNNKIADSWTPVKIGDVQNFSQNIDLEGGTLYVFSVQRNNLGVENLATLSAALPNTTPFHQLNSDNTFAPAAASISVDSDKSILFYTDQTIKLISVTNAQVNNGSKIILRKANVNYQLADSLHQAQSSCTSANPNKGCVYFDERSVTGSSSYESLSSTDDPWSSYGVSGINSGAVNLANNLFQVTPDRDCAQWLACKSYVYDSNSKKNVCYDVANCDRLDGSGNCVNFTVMNTSTNRVYDPTGTIAGAENQNTIGNLTGYVKVGWPTVDKFSDLRIIPNDLLNFGLMSQTGDNATVPNGDFELYEATTSPMNSGTIWIGNPANWTAAGGQQWTTSTADSFFSVVSDPQTAQAYGFSIDRSKSADTYPMNGKAFLRYNATNKNNFPESDVISVQPGQAYYLSFYVNTFNLKSSGDKAAQAKINILYGDGTKDIVLQDYGDGWVLKTQKFTVPAGSVNSTIRLLLGASDGSSGNVYIDDIQISPVLLTRNASNYIDNSLGKTANLSDTYARQTCRLYPQENSLSCAYYDDTGIFQQGDLGYCLQYDSAPGDPNTCILWWPIDEVQGTGIKTNQADGYDNRAPLYYCTKLSPAYINPAEVRYSSETTFDYTINNKNERINLNGGCDLNFSEVNNDLTSIEGTSYLPLNYGKNTISITLNNNCRSSNDVVNFSGTYHYQNGTKSFDFAQMFKDLQKKSCGNGKDTDSCKQNMVYSDGSVFNVQYSCGDSEVDNTVEVVSGDIDYSSCAGPEDMGKNSLILTYTFNIEPACAQVANVVNSYGDNKAWVERVRQGGLYPFQLTCNKNMPSSFTFDNPDPIKETKPPMLDDIFTTFPVNSSNGGECTASASYPPFGSANPPAGNLSYISSPSFWTSPLPYVGTAASGQMGQLYDPSDLKYLFAQSYGVWDWNTTTGRYAPNAGGNWSAPNNWCSNNIRPAGNGTNSNCAVAPTVSNILLNSSPNTSIFGNGVVDITFDSHVDPQQVPLASYSINWGDGEVLNNSNAAGTAHSANHIYSYYDLLNKFNANNHAAVYPTINCPADGNECYVTPSIKLVDNWGWCTEGGAAGQPCPIPGFGHCINPSTRATLGNLCRSNSNCSGSGANSICADGWWESPGQVTVYKQ